jgi:predicted lipoprotein with Yx(FWY)xxD motif
MKKQLSFTALLLIVLFSNNIYSQWSVDPTVNNPICTQVNTQNKPAITGDGSGGAIIIWEDNRDGIYNYNIYAQKINSSAVAQWAEDGVAICTQASAQNYSSITSDGSGGAIITWQDGRHGNPTIYAQRIDATGAPQWTDAATGGVAISTLSTGQFAPTITEDGSGGAIITWYDWRNGNSDIYAQRINASGVVQWTANGLPVCTQTSHQYYPTITGDGSGGAIITWYEDRIGNQDIYAQRINSSGATQWTTVADGGLPVCTNGSRQDDPTLTFDGSGGAIITWYDFRNSNWDIYAQRINSSGETQWTTAADGGLPVCTLTSDQLFQDISSDGSGGAIITWQDNRNANADIYAQRINSSGAAQWVVDGIAISTGGIAYDPVITGDASGGIVTWRDDRNSADGDIYASKASPDGALPVELTKFTANILGNKVTLNWQTATEVDNYGFDVERTFSHSTEWQKIGFVQGNGNSNSPKEYSFADNSATSGKYAYRLKQIDNDGTYKYSNEIKVDLGIPTEFSLQQNYPNPFNPETVINYQLPVSGNVSLKVFDMLGREVATIVNEVQKAGMYDVSFNGKAFASGTYFYRFQSGNYVKINKMVLMK